MSANAVKFSNLHIFHGPRAVVECGPQRSQGVDMKAQIAGCIFIGLTQQCLGDATLLTCRGGAVHSYIAEGGASKPGWSMDEGEKVTNLIQKESARGAFFDIQTTVKDVRLSFLEDACSIERKSGGSELELTFVVTCKEMISTFLFYARNGIYQLLETHLGLFREATGASVSMTKDCKRGD